MKESIGEASSLPIIALFILLFVSFLTIMISYSKCFKTKNEVISIIEKYEGLTPKSKKIIGDFLLNNNYKGTGRCPDDYKGFSTDGNVVADGAEASYCIKHNLVNDSTLIYYNVILFYSFNLSFGNIATFEVKGKTNDLNTNNYYDHYLPDSPAWDL